MKNQLLLIGLMLLFVVCKAQSCITKEIRIDYSNGIEIFNICISDPAITYYDDKEYFWYTEFSKIKSTKGGSGGNLLSGSYKFYNKNGDLEEEINYNKGLKEGAEKHWNLKGEIVWKATYDRGEMTYWKFLNEEDLWIEFNGRLLLKGSTRKVYTKTNKLLSEEIMLEDFFKSHKKIYDTTTGNLLQVLTSSDGNHLYVYGEYIEYHSNGKIKVKGQFLDEDRTNIKTGTWTSYNEDGSISHEEIYKPELKKWPNGLPKIGGSYYWDPLNEEWIKDGLWYQYNDKGHIIIKKKYSLGKEVDFE